MNFHEVVSYYSFFKKYLPKEIGHKERGTQFYERLLSLPDRIFQEMVARDQGVLTHQLLTEWEWYKGNHPYFLIHPDIIPSLSKMAMDIPAKLIQFPNHPRHIEDVKGLMRTFVIRLPESNPLPIDEKYGVRSIMAWCSDRSYAEKTCRRFKFIPKCNEEQQLMIWIDIGEIDKSNILPGVGLPIWTYRSLIWSGEDTVEQAQGKLPTSESALEGIVMSDELIHKCIRLVLSVCFLMQGNSKLLKPIGLSSDLREVSPEERQTRAAKAGKYGWLVGYDSLFTPSTTAGTGEGLKWAHIRGMHWHTVRFGAGKAESRVDLYMDTVVRPDLPFKKDKL